MLRDNPYNASGTTEAVSGGIGLRLRTVLWWLIFLYPVIILAMVYMCWGLTALSLERAPRFGEQPGHDVVHTAVYGLGTVAAIGLLVCPVLVPMGVAWCVTQPFAGRSDTGGVTSVRRIVCTCAYLLMLLTCVWIWNDDPWGAVYWFID